MDIAVVVGVLLLLLFVALVAVGAIARVLILALTGRSIRRRTPAENSGGPKLDDPVFGTMFYDQSAGLWSGALAVDNDETIVIFVSAPAAGPDDSQREFFQRLCAWMPDLAQLRGEFSALKDRLRAEAGNWAPATGKGMDAQFRLYAVQIPTAADPQQWEAEFMRCDVDDLMVYCASFAGKQFKAIRSED